MTAVFAVRSYEKSASGDVGTRQGAVPARGGEGIWQCRAWLSESIEVAPTCPHPP